jgi:hypothetical protein
MNTTVGFYLCPTCFYASDCPDDSHEHALLRVNPGLPGDEKRKPITDRNGRILSAAPHWFHDAVTRARVGARSPYLNADISNTMQR